MAESIYDRMRQSSHLAGNNVAYIEDLFEAYLADPDSVSEEWRDYFNRLPTVAGTASGQAGDVSHRTLVEHFERLGRNRLKAQPEKVATSVATEHERKQISVTDLITAYRQRGHKRANLDPLGLAERDEMPILDLAFHNLGEADLNTTFRTDGFFFDEPTAPLRDIIDALETTYCGTVGAEYTHIVDASEQLWVKQRLESVRSHPEYSQAAKRHILERLTAAEGLEKYLHNRYPGTKRFGLEGGESLIPMLHEALQRTGSHGVVETVIGMAHRGRLNVLVNILGKQPSELFDEFDGKLPEDLDGSGDVKYHQGFSSNLDTPGGEMHLALAFNPSHLEIVSPVVEGSVRARQDRREDLDHNLVLPIILHGDAAFAGQGVVLETFQMSQTRGYSTGGTVHIIINNQIGFTTHKRIDARSTEYCTEVAKMVQAPIFHVNGDDPEAVVFVTELAIDYRMQFKKDVVIDLVCYRRRGHNEAEEPQKTQPLMYNAIKKQPTTRALYAQRLIGEGVITEIEDSRFVENYRMVLDEGGTAALSLVHEPNSQLFVDWSRHIDAELVNEADTSFDRRRFVEIAHQLNQVPEDFALHRQVKRIVADRAKMADGEEPINWGFGEVMAYATLLDEGYGVRITGQDVGVGTFSHRHAVFHNQTDGGAFVPLDALNDSEFELFDSLLSEEAVLAFEYGYATTTPDQLVIWEAQFGDFANGAQVVIDQFISSGEIKWARVCGLTMLLPHGYEGAGPEHSSARLERYLQLCAEHNMQVCIPSTPAQVYHMLRRQMVRDVRKPLVALTPKSLLRHKLATSTLDELTEGRFQVVLPEVDALKPDEVTRVVFCSGKVFYDLLEARREAEAKQVAIVRIEQLYPFPSEELATVLAPYKNARDVIWCQEEPMNQGAWHSTQHLMRRVVLDHNDDLLLGYAGREAFAAPAGGYASVHTEQQQKLVQDALFG